MPRKKTHEEFLRDLKLINNKIDVIGEYKGVRVSIEVKCKVCGKEYSILPDSLLAGKKCRTCTSKKRGLKQRKTHEQFMNEMKETNNINNIIILGKYISQENKIACKCPKHNIYFESNPVNLLQGCTGCKQCEKEKAAKKRRKTHEQFVEELFKINQTIEVLGEYKGNGFSIKCKCKNCNNITFPTPSNLLNGQGGCKKCGAKRRGLASRLSHAEFTKRVNTISPNISFMSEYVDSHSRVRCKCEIDGNEWAAKAGHLLNGHGCPKCASSNGEQEISEILEENQIDYIIQYRFEDCKYKRPLPFDFYLPKLNTTIEFDGIQHFEPVEYFGGQKAFEYRQKVDDIKTKYCEEKGINLIRIPYYEENIEKVLMDNLLCSR